MCTTNYYHHPTALRLDYHTDVHDTAVAYRESDEGKRGGRPSITNAQTSHTEDDDDDDDERMVKIH